MLSFVVLGGLMLLTVPLNIVCLPANDCKCFILHLSYCLIENNSVVDIVNSLICYMLELFWTSATGKDNVW